MASKQKISVDEIRKHSSADDCWIVVEDKIWDVTEFLPEHPGGPGIILRYAGDDATTAYNEIHAPSVLPENLDKSKNKGVLDRDTIDAEWAKPPPDADNSAKPGEKPPLEKIINLYDFEDAAKIALSEKTWAFYSGAATDCLTRDRNREMLDRMWFRPRLLRNVSEVSTKGNILGIDVNLPLFVSPAALAKLADPDGEKTLARACASSNIIQCISSNASFPVQEIVEATPENHPSIFQLYVNRDRSKTAALIKHVLSLRPRIRAIFLTIDAPDVGKREADERLKADESITAPNSGGQTQNDAKGGGLGRTAGSYIDPALCWDDLQWIQKQLGNEMPLVLKGVQCADDAKLAMEAGCQGIVVGNHGGRCLDGSPPAVLILLEIHRMCPEVLERMEVYIDGGIRRGTDVLKCLCLGATAVGIGRHFLYSLNYGQEGAEKLIYLLKDELETTMKNVGIKDLSEAHPGLVNTADVDHLVPTAMGVHPYARWRPKARM